MTRGDEPMTEDTLNGYEQDALIDWYIGGGGGAVERILAARTAALARDRDALAAKITRVEALAAEWTTATCQLDGAPCSWHRIAAECADTLAAALAGPEDTAQDTQRDDEGSGPCKTWPRPDWCQSPCPGGICAPVPADHGTDRADEEGEA